MTALFDLNPADVAIPLGTWPTADEALGLQTPGRAEGVSAAARADELAGGGSPPPSPPASAPRVLGLDLSLTGTGLAGDGWADTITFPACKKRENRLDYAHRRIAHIRSTIADYLAGVDLVVIEGLSFDSYDTNRQNAGLSWMVRHDLWRRDIPYALVPPSNLKQYATGSGNASKAQVVETVRSWFGWFDGDDNAADATVLFAAGRQHLGAPVVRVPDVQRAALAPVVWPELTHA